MKNRLLLRRGRKPGNAPFREVVAWMLILSLTFLLVACGDAGSRSSDENKGQTGNGAVTGGGIDANGNDVDEPDGSGNDNAAALSFTETVIDTGEGKIVFGVDADASDFETGALQLYIRNETKKEMGTGREYSIQRYEDRWTTLPLEIAWTDDLLTIQPGGKITMNIDLCYDQYAYKKGAYRINKSYTNEDSAFIEFTVNRDIRYDRDKMFSLLDLNDAVITYRGMKEYKLTHSDERETDLMTIINDVRSARLAVPDTEAYLRENRFLGSFKIRVPRYNIETGMSDTSVTQEIVYERRSKQDLLYFRVYREDWGETGLYEPAHEEVYAIPDEYSVQYLRDLFGRIKKAAGA
jgi:hypothetical protein